VTYLPTRGHGVHEADQLWRGRIIAANANGAGTWAERITPAHIVTGSGAGTTAASTATGS